MKDDKERDPYYYEGTYTFVNIKGIRERKTLEQYEGAVALMRIAELSSQPIPGDHSLQHWQNIHKFIFQDVYEWAGKARKIRLFEEFDSPYSDPQTIQAGFSHLVVPLLDKTNHLKSCTASDAVKEISSLMGELYYIHPFRDGNTRSLIQFVKEIAREAKIQIDFSHFNESQWNDLQHGIVLAAHNQDASILESTIASSISFANIDTIQHEHQHLLETAPSYTEQFKTLVLAKEGQAMQLESRIEAAVLKQRDSVATTRTMKPGAVASLWKGAAWEKGLWQRQSRLEVLEKRLSRVRGIRTGMAGRRLEEFARKKLQRADPELVAGHDAQQRQFRERQAEENLRLTREKERTQTQGRGRSLRREP